MSDPFTESQPPASYFPPPADGSVAPVARPATPVPVTPARGSSTSAQTSQGPPPSLIKRMGLQAKVAAEDKGKGKAGEGSAGAGAAGGWSPDASQREQNLRARKEKLVLEARRCVSLSVSLSPRRLSWPSLVQASLSDQR